MKEFNQDEKLFYSPLSGTNIQRLDGSVLSFDGNFFLAQGQEDISFLEKETSSPNVSIMEATAEEYTAYKAKLKGLADVAAAEKTLAAAVEVEEKLEKQENEHS